MKKFMLILTFLSIIAATTNAQKLPKDTATWNLARCIEYVLANNINVKEAELNKEGADINYKQSKIERFPILNASATQNISNNTSTESQTWLYNSTQVGVNIQITLYNGGKITNKIKKVVPCMCHDRDFLWMVSGKKASDLDPIIALHYE